MSKVLFTADLHIKLGQRNVPKEWQKQRYKELFEYLHQYATEVDLVILGGDIFDKLPTPEEFALYTDLILGFNTKTVIIDGNHESGRKGVTWLTQFKAITSAANPLVQIVDEITTINGIQFLPYCKLHKELESLNPESNILVTHVRGKIEPYVKPEVDLSLFEKWDVVFAGDLHSHSNTQLNIVYPGSPLTTSFHRSTVETGILLIETDDPKNYQFIPLELPQLIRKTVSSEEEIKEGVYDHIIYEITGTTSELIAVKDNELLDKKINIKESSAELDLSISTTVEQEIETYAKEVLNLDNEAIATIVEMYSGGISDSP